MLFDIVQIIEHAVYVVIGELILLFELELEFEFELDL